MDETGSRQLRENAPLHAVSAILALVFLMLALFGDASDPHVTGAAHRAAPAAAPPDALPASAEDEGTILSTLPADDARARNAAVPFADTDLAAARPFAFHGSSADRTRARDCLALAAMAEAGAGEPDQRAVMQVILNRVRHPAFANTVCGVIFQGSERPTGCQFTFTCDGSLARSYSEALWRAARQRAEEALGGYVHAPVGTATHYHADYVYPAWSGELDKIAAVGPHLFFRWRGWWGSGAAMSARYTGGEPDPLALRRTAQEVDRPVELLLPRLAEQGMAVRTITASGGGEAEATPVGAAEASTAAPASPAPGVHFVLVARGDAPQTLVERARALCPGDAYCQVYGWDDAAAIPAELPLTGEARRVLRFSFLPARNGNAEAIYFDCRIFASPPVGACLPRARP
ncbi:cell wall hydrolase [Pelagerythrobacter rhizovicinus]|uniref:Cell wall hydrolase n=1 Tax=Pelagerythrobacter rhizovicinus TaxID=2268576 RepID=A0A4Q2KN08_9SPHN|nr:cell wall hydrolase [Pelagerythrobacter rhizovicinus]RXZ65909.1 cell wall hydrolase [Pelagerythrobacter rhizovicinus]